MRMLVEGTVSQLNVIKSRFRSLGVSFSDIQEEQLTAAPSSDADNGGTAGNENTDGQNEDELNLQDAGHDNEAEDSNLDEAAGSESEEETDSKGKKGKGKNKKK